MSKNRKKDPHAPKKPLSSFLEFCRDLRSNSTNELFKLPLVDVGRELGKRWKELHQDEKAKYEERAKANRERYSVELEKYQLDKSNNSEEQDSEETSVPVQAVSETSLEGETLSPEVESSSSKSVIHPDSLGFGRQKKYSWHPALKLGEFAEGTRIRVQFFGTGQLGRLGHD